MARKRIAAKSGMKIATICDSDTTAGLLLAGIGSRDGAGRQTWLDVTSHTRRTELEDGFKEFTTSSDVCIVLITQTLADQIRYLLDAYTKSGQVVPTILEIPSKDCPYDAKNDSLMQRVQVFFGERAIA